MAELSKDENERLAALKLYERFPILSGLGRELSAFGPDEDELKIRFENGLVSFSKFINHLHDQENARRKQALTDWLAQHFPRDDP